MLDRKLTVQASSRRPMKRTPLFPRPASGEPLPSGPGQMQRTAPSRQPSSQPPGMPSQRMTQLMEQTASDQFGSGISFDPLSGAERKRVTKPSKNAPSLVQNNRNSTDVRESASAGKRGSSGDRQRDRSAGDGTKTVDAFSSTLAVLPDAAGALHQRLRAAIEAEQEYAQQQVQGLFTFSNLKRLQKEGLTLTGLQAAVQGTLYSSTICRLTLRQDGGKSRGKGKEGKQPKDAMVEGESANGDAGAGGQRLTNQSRGRAGQSLTMVDLPYHKFQQREAVLLTAWPADSCECCYPKDAPVASLSEPSSGPNTVQLDQASFSHTATPSALSPCTLNATIVEIHPQYVHVAIEQEDYQNFLSLIHSPVPLAWRLDQCALDITAKRQLAALQRLYDACCDTAQHAKHGQDPPPEQVLRAVLVGAGDSGGLASLTPPWVNNQAWRLSARQTLADFPNLNSSQRRAVATALTRSVTLWQGPPGTGKTWTLLALMEVLVAASSKRTPAGGPPSKASNASTHVPLSPNMHSSGPSNELGPVLACADTNAAVDNLVAGLLSRGVHVVRVGQAAKVRSELRSLTLEALAEATPTGKEAVALRTLAQEALQKLEAMASSSRKLTPQQAAMARAKADEMLTRSAGLLKEACKSVVQNAQVVASTCSGAADPLLSNINFRMVVLDEASQATEPSTWVPLMKGCQCCVLAGDPLQLPPTVVSPAAIRSGLDVSLFQRLAGKIGLQPLLLNTQYRMHPQIAEFPNKWFYKGRLVDGTSPDERRPPAGLNWPDYTCPVAMVCVQGEERRVAPRVRGGQKAAGSSSGGVSFANPMEAKVVIQLAERALASGDVQSVAILTPYKGQVQLIERMLGTRDRTPPGDDFVQRMRPIAGSVQTDVADVSLVDGVQTAADQHAERDAELVVAGHSQQNNATRTVVADAARTKQVLKAAATLPLYKLLRSGVITVSSVDGYQGRQAELVIFSSVRCNKEGTLGFVSEPRRMNVALTRAERGLLVVGDDYTLSHSGDWGKWLSWVQSKQVKVLAEDLLGQEIIEDAHLDYQTDSDMDT